MKKKLEKNLQITKRFHGGRTWNGREVRDSSFANGIIPFAVVCSLPFLPVCDVPLSCLRPFFLPIFDIFPGSLSFFVLLSSKLGGEGREEGVVRL